MVTKKHEIKPEWYVIDANEVALGRIASRAAQLLKGKHRPYYQPDQLIGDFVVIINADKMKITGNKINQKKYYYHTGYPGGIRDIPLSEVMEKKPEFALEKAIKGMLPKNKLGRKMFKRLHIYRNEVHPHTAQKPEKITL